MANKLFDRDKHRQKRESELKKTEEFNRKRKEAEFEKGDLLAIILAALTTIVPVAIVVVLVIWFLSMLVIGLFR